MHLLLAFALAFPHLLGLASLAAVAGLTFTINSTALMNTPNKMSQGFISIPTTIPAAGIAVTAANFGFLNTLSDVLCFPVEVEGSVNTETLIAKYDPVTNTIFFFWTAAVISLPLAVITGDITASAVVPFIAFGT